MTRSRPAAAPRTPETAPSVGLGNLTPAKPVLGHPRGGTGQVCSERGLTWDTPTLFEKGQKGFYIRDEGVDGARVMDLKGAQYLVPHAWVKRDVTATKTCCRSTELEGCASEHGRWRDRKGNCRICGEKA